VGEVPPLVIADENITVVPAQIGLASGLMEMVGKIEEVT